MKVTERRTKGGARYIADVRFAVVVSAMKQPDGSLMLKVGPVSLKMNEHDAKRVQKVLTRVQMRRSSPYAAA